MPLICCLQELTILREITVVENGKSKTFFPITYGNSNELLFSKVLNDTTAYIKINNSLGNTNLIAEFDKTLDSFPVQKSDY
jgi:carboxyl-terminal processing protease